MRYSQGTDCSNNLLLSTYCSMQQGTPIQEWNTPPLLEISPDWNTLIQLLQASRATSGKGGIGPYIGLCALSACFGVADAHVQGGMVGDLSFMCPEFIQVGLPHNFFIVRVFYILIMHLGSGWNIFIQGDG